MQVRKHTSKRSILFLKLRADVTKQEYQWPQKRTHVLQFFFFNDYLVSVEVVVRC